MTDYRVDWAARAESQLANIWLYANDRNSVTAAAAWLDAILGETPLRFG